MTKMKMVGWMKVGDGILRIVGVNAGGSEGGE